MKKLFLCFAAVFALANCFNIATAGSSDDSTRKTAQKFSDQRQLLNYDNGSAEANVVASYSSGGIYESLVAQTDGLPNDPTKEFKCSDDGFFRFVSNLFEVTNKTLIIEMTFSVGNAAIGGKSAIPAAAGAPTPDGIPIVMLSDIKGTCRAAILKSKVVVPPTIINGGTSIGIRYTIYTAVTRDFTFFQTVVDTSTDIAKAIGATKFVAQVTAPALNAAISSFNTMLSQNGAKAEFSSVDDQFDLLQNSGIKYAWTDLAGSPFSTSIISKPALSIFTATIKTGAGAPGAAGGSSVKTYIPDFQGSLDPQRVYGSDLLQEFDPLTGKPTWASVSDYLETAGTGQTFLADLRAAKTPTDFRTRCDNLRTKKLAEYSSGLGLDTWDTDIALYAILSPLAWTYDPAYRDCTPKPILDVYSALGLETTVRKRSADVAAINGLMSSLSARLKSSSSDQINAFLTSVTTSALTFDDPAGITGANPPSKHEDIIKSLSTLSAANVGCFAPANESSVAERVGLIVLKDNRRLWIDLMTTSPEGDAGASQISSIGLYPMDPNDVDSIATIKAILGTNPAKNGGCSILLSKSFGDFDDVKARKPG